MRLLASLKSRDTLPYHVSPSDATAHAPACEAHPYESLDPVSMPADMGYGCKMVDGVMHVYTEKNIMEK